MPITQSLKTLEIFGIRDFFFRRERNSFPRTGIFCRYLFSFEAPSVNEVTEALLGWRF